MHNTCWNLNVHSHGAKLRTLTILIWKQHKRLFLEMNLDIEFLSQNVL